MKNLVLLTGLTFGLLSPAVVFAGDLAGETSDQTVMASTATGDPEAIRIADAAGACGEQTLLSAVFNDKGEVEATCGDVTAFVPLLGGLAPALGAAGLAAAGALGAAGGGNGPADTQ